MNSEQYKAPILTQVYWLVGGLCLLVGLIGAAGCWSKGQQMAGFIGIFLSILVALLCFGVAQVVNHIGQTAHNTRQIADLLRGGGAAQTPPSSPVEERMNTFVRSEPSLRKTIAPKQFLLVVASLATAAQPLQAQDVMNYGPAVPALRHPMGQGVVIAPHDPVRITQPEYHFPISPTIADLRIGITAEQCRLILGNPLRINGSQWVYPRGYIYIEGGKVTAMQNRNGGVFAADWK